MVLLFIISQVASVKIMKVYSDTILFPKIVIYTSVLNQQGNPITSLSAEDFTIYEDKRKCGKPDSVLPFPTDSAFFSLLLIDVSKNMADKDVRLVEMVLWKIYQQRTDKQIIGVALFADTLIPLFSPDEKINLESVRLKFQQIRNKLKKKDAKLIDIIAASLLKFQEETKNYPLSAVVVFSKGIDNGSKTGLQDIKKVAIKTQIPVFTVGINEEGNLLSQISDTVGGEHISGKTANEIELAYDRVFLRVRHSMLLLYRTRVLPGDGKPHLVWVEVHKPQAIKGKRFFITPKKRIFRLDTSFFIVLGFIIVIIGLFVGYNKLRLIKSKKRRLKEISIPSFEEPLVEKAELEEKPAKPPEAEKVEQRKDKTVIFSPYITLEIKKYSGKENIIYKNKQLTTDTSIEIEYNKLISIGSADTNDLVLPGISSTHFTLKCEYASFMVNAIDEIYINGQAVKGKVRYEEKGKYIINAGPYILILVLK